MDNTINQASPSSKSTSTQDPLSMVLDAVGLAALLGISPATIPSLRSRNPAKLPPPFLTRPLRWRRDAVLKWMERREREEEERHERELATTMRALRRA